MGLLEKFAGVTDDVGTDDIGVEEVETVGIMPLVEQGISDAATVRSLDVGGLGPMLPSEGRAG